MTQLIIPKKIKVGYQNREDTYTGKLAYVIYYDHKGVLRKETSWQNWRDKSIDTEEFDNVPTDGFVINKETRRFRWSHFGSDRSYIRMYDPRGVEFEIPPDNLIGLLMETDCNKRMFEGEFVYAWSGKDLVLLPCGSQDYKDAVEHTARQDKKVSARELKAGYSYTDKNGNELIYMGRHPWYYWGGYRAKTQERYMKKEHIFWTSQKFEVVTSVPNRISYVNADESVQQYPELFDNLMSDIRTQEIVGWDLVPIENPELKLKNGYSNKLVPEDYQPFFIDNGDSVIQLKTTCKYYHTEDGMYVYKGVSMNKETLKSDYYKDHEVHSVYVGYRNRPRNNLKTYTTEELVEIFRQRKDVCALYAVLGNGKRYKMESIDPYYLPGRKR